MQDVIESEIIEAILQDGISQVDENLTIDEFECDFDKKTRKLKVHFTVVNSETTEKIEMQWGD